MYLCCDAISLAILFDTDNFSMAVKFDRLPRQGVRKVQREIQGFTLKIGLYRQEINTGPADVACDGLFLADTNRDLKLDAL